MTAEHEQVVFVDVDDTLVRELGTRRIPMPRVVERVKELAACGATLYCWSAGGAEYAKETATELGIAQCFQGFLPKPNIFLDDQEPQSWSRYRWVHPLDVG